MVDTWDAAGPFSRCPRSLRPKAPRFAPRVGWGGRPLLPALALDGCAAPSLSSEGRHRLRQGRRRRRDRAARAREGLSARRFAEIALRGSRPLVSITLDFVRVESASCVPHGQDFDRARRDPIDHAVASVNELADLGSANLGYAAAPIRKAAENLYCVEQAADPALRGCLAACCDVFRSFRRPCDGERRPANGDSHARRIRDRTGFAPLSERRIDRKRADARPCAHHEGALVPRPGLHTARRPSAPLHRVHSA